MSLRSQHSISLEAFHQRSHSISAQFDAYIAGVLQKRPDAPILQRLYRKFIERKIGKQHQRVVLVYIASIVLGAEVDSDLSNLLPVMAVPELMNWSTYALNWVTDEKNNMSGTKMEENIDLIASQYLLTEALSFLPERMLRRYFDLYRWEMRGFLAVEEELRISNFDALRDERAFWKAYSSNHCIPDVGSLYAYCFEVVDDYFELHTDPSTMARVRKIMLEFGRAMQVSGDLSDFIRPNANLSTTEKRPTKDYFIDIRTDRLTYPVWLLLRSTAIHAPDLHAETRRVAEERRIPDGYYERVQRFMQQNRLMHDPLRFLVHEKRRLSREITKLQLNDEGTSLWQAALVILVENKFLKQVRAEFGS